MGFKIIIWCPFVVADRNKVRITDHVTDHVTDHDRTPIPEPVEKLLLVLSGEMSRQELMGKLGLSHRPSFSENYLQPAIDDGYVEMTLPDKPSIFILLFSRNS